MVHNHWVQHVLTEYELEIVFEGLWTGTLCEQMLVLLRDGLILADFLNAPLSPSLVS